MVKAPPKDSLMTPVLINQVAALAIQNLSVKQMADRLSVSERQVRNALETKEYAVAVAALGDMAFESAKAYLRTEVSKLSHEVLRVLRKRLEEDDSLEAVKISLKVLGLDEAEERQSDTNITVMLPTAEKAIDATVTTSEEPTYDLVQDDKN